MKQKDVNAEIIRRRSNAQMILREYLAKLKLLHERRFVLVRQIIHALEQKQLAQTRKTLIKQ